MDWQLIILTLGASFLTGAITIVSNIIISNANIKKAKLEKTVNSQMEYLSKVNNIYSEILDLLFYVETYLNQKNKEELHLYINKLDYYWKRNFNYCSKTLNNEIYCLIEDFEKNTIQPYQIEYIRDLIKIDTNKLYGINFDK